MAARICTKWLPGLHYKSTLSSRRHKNPKLSKQQFSTHKMFLKVVHEAVSRYNSKGAYWPLMFCTKNTQLFFIRQFQQYTKSLKSPVSFETIQTVPDSFKTVQKLEQARYLQLVMKPSKNIWIFLSKKDRRIWPIFTVLDTDPSQQVIMHSHEGQNP